MQKAATTFCVIIFLHLSSFGQALHYTPLEDSVLVLMKKDSSASLSFELPPYTSFGITGYNINRFDIVKAGKTIYLLPQGTQRVYRYNDSTNAFDRLDTTYYGGTNFGFYPFYYNHTLYQYGGYGFWGVRDFITYFYDNTKDWQPARSSGFIYNNYGYNRLFFTDQQNGKLYVDGYMTPTPDHSDYVLHTDSVFEYDISKKTWTAIGRLNNLVSKRDGFVNLCETPFGNICRINGGFYLASFAANTITPLSRALNDSLYLFLNNNSIDFNSLVRFYFRDTLYLLPGNASKTTVYRFRISAKDVESAKAQPLWLPYPFISLAKKWMRENIILILLAANLVFIFFLLGIVRRWKRKMQLRYAIPIGLPGNGLGTHTDISRPAFETGAQAFNGRLEFVEKELLRELITHSLRDHKMSMPQMNKLLGITHKDDVIQKNRRSAVINKINGAYTSSFKSAAELVKREKDPEDRRSNTYYVDKEIAEKLKEYFL